MIGCGGMFMKQSRLVIISGLSIGAASVLLMRLGNPANMGICVACFIRDIAGGLGLHRAAAWAAKGGTAG